MSTALFAGSFDPFTMGHYDILSRACKLFDKVTVGVAESTGAKTCMLSADMRKEIVVRSVSDLQNVEVRIFNRFLVDFMREIDADVLVRGLRTANDFEYEKALTEVYKSQNSRVETLYLISSHTYSHISGSVVRELAGLGGSIQGYVHPAAEQRVREMYRKQG